MGKNKIVKSWELKATSQKSFYKKEWESLEVEKDPASYYYHEAANMGNQYYSIPFACRW